MDKIKFEALAPQGKINFMNDKLKEGLTLTMISGEIKISRKTIAKKLIEVGYSFSKQEKSFIKSSDYKDNTNILSVVKPIENKGVSKHEYKPNTNIFDSKESTTKMLDIIEKHDNIQEMLEWYNKQKNIIDVDIRELKINSDKLHGDVKTTTVRLYTDVWEQFRVFMNEYSEFKSMDLVSMSLVEYMERYKKS